MRNDTPALARAQERARRDGVSPPLYALARLVLTLLLGSWFRFHPSGAEHLPEHGPAIVAPNHKSFIDAFFVGIATRGAGRRRHPPPGLLGFVESRRRRREETRERGVPAAPLALIGA